MEESEQGLREQLIAAIDAMSADEQRILLQKLGEQPPRERRRHPRKPYFTDVKYAGGSHIYQDLVKNISLGGVLIETRRPRADLSIGQEITLSVPFSRHKNYMRIIGEIVRISPHEIGIKFKKVLRYPDDQSAPAG